MAQTVWKFGWVITEQHHGRGYATSVGAQLITYALDSVRLPRVLAACSALNAASEHVVRDKLKMRFECEIEITPGFRRRVYEASAGWRCNDADRRAHRRR